MRSGKVALISALGMVATATAVYSLAPAGSGGVSVISNEPVQSFVNRAMLSIVEAAAEASGRGAENAEESALVLAPDAPEAEPDASLAITEVAPTPQSPEPSQDLSRPAPDPETAVRSPARIERSTVRASSGPSPLALPCQNDMICGTHRCNRKVGRCAFPCTSEADCASGFVCLGEGGPTAICVPP